MGYKAALLSLGCKVNSYETERIREDLVKKGFEIVDFNDIADAYIINTCSVTNIADRKSRQMLHRAKTLNPRAVVVATGCYVQTEKDSSRILDVADFIIGNNHKGKVADLLTEVLDKKTDKEEKDPEQTDVTGLLNKSDRVVVDDMACEKNVEELSINDYPERSRAFVRIEDGCNQFCSYCIIPYARGRVRSRDEGDIVSEVKSLAKNGFKEVVITGIHISSYGYENYEKKMKSLSDSQSMVFDSEPLLSLIKRISEVEGIERIRLSSLEPRIITKEFALELKKIKSFCPHFHLSLQSGCDTVLKRMNRHYTSDEFIEKTKLLREVFDRPSINTDVIVGFPGESEEEFQETVSFVEKAAFAKMHIFKYSRRKGTAADKMPGQIIEKEKHARSLVLQDLDIKMHKEYVSSFVGEKVYVLVEEEKDGCLSGLTERYVTVNIPVKDDMRISKYINSILPVSVWKMDENGILIGKISESCAEEVKE